MLRGLTAKQFAELLAYKRLEPFRELREDYRTASIVQVIANVNRGKKQKAYTLEEMRLKFGEQEQKRKQTWQEQLALLTIFAKLHNSSPDAVVEG